MGDVHNFSPGTRGPPHTRIASRQSPVSMNLHHCVSGSVVPPEEEIWGMIIKNVIKHNQSRCLKGLKINLLTVTSTITACKPLSLQLMGASEPTLPEAVTRKGRTLIAVSSKSAEKVKEH